MVCCVLNALRIKVNLAQFQWPLSYTIFQAVRSFDTVKLHIRKSAMYSQTVKRYFVFFIPKDAHLGTSKYTTNVMLHALKV